MNDIVLMNCRQPKLRFARPGLQELRKFEGTMSDYRRYFVPGGTFYFTVGAYARRPILTTDHGRTFLRNAIASVRKRHPLSLVANVLLPEHWHLIMQLPNGDDRYSLRMKQIKSEFTEQWLEAGCRKQT